MSGDCLICTRIARITDGTNPFFVAELETGYVVMGDYQFFRGYTLFLCKRCVPELHDLDEDFRLRFLAEMSAVAEAVFRCFKPRKLNYQLLGNRDRHLHWHLTPRHADDPNPGGPTQEIDKALRYSDSARPSAEELRALKRDLLVEVEKVAGGCIVRRILGQL